LLNFEARSKVLPHFSIESIISAANEKVPDHSEGERRGNPELKRKIQPKRLSRVESDKLFSEIIFA
jgi:hypothetical protein